MSGTIIVQSGIIVNNGASQYTSSPRGFTAVQSNLGGPTPGTLSIPTSVTDVTFSALTLPGVIHLVNLDATNFVTFGLHDTSVFRPLGEILPGETWVFRLSRTLLTANTAADKFALLADTATVKVLVACFDS